MESISLMKPKAQTEHEDGLLEYLEDIIGTSRYKMDIEEANARLDQLNEERSEKLNRLKFVEKDKNSLEVRHIGRVVFTNPALLNLSVLLISGEEKRSRGIHFYGEYAHEEKESTFPCLYRRM